MQVRVPPLEALVLARLWHGPDYGYNIRASLTGHGSGTAIYKILWRLANRGFVTPIPEPTAHHLRINYALTEKGVKAALRYAQHWEECRDVLDDILAVVHEAR